MKSRPLALARIASLALCLTGLLPVAPTFAAAPETLAAQLQGTVVGPDGAPLEGARISLLPCLDAYRSGRLRLEGRREADAAAYVVSGPDGRYRLPLREPGVWQVTVEAEGSVPMTLLPVVAGWDDELPPVRLERSDPLELRLLRSSGEPLSETWVFAEGEVDQRVFRSAGPGWLPSFRVALTAADGRITIPRAGGEVLRVSAFPRGAAPESWTVERSGDLAARSAAGAPRAIRVVDPDGSPVAGALVRAGEVLWPAAVTDAAGRARVLVRAGAETRLLVLAADGRRLEHRLPGPAEADAPAPETRLVIPAPLVLSGRVLDGATGRPLPGALVWISADPGLFARTDSEGRYRLAAVGSEPFLLQAEAAGHVPARAPIELGRLAEGRVPSLSLPVASRVQGTVVDRSGEPVAGAAVAAVLRLPEGRRPYLSPDPADSRAATGGAGQFELTTLLPGAPYELAASAPGFTPSRREILSPLAGDAGTPIRLVLSAERAAVGRVLGPEDRPVARATVSLQAHGSDPRSVGGLAEPGPDPFAAESGDDGRFRITRIPGEELDVEVRGEGFAPMTVRRVPVPPGTGTVELGTFRLLPGVELVGRVVGPEGEPVAGASVHAFDESLARWPSRRLDARHGPPDAVSDADGRFRISGLPEGGIRDLVIRAEGYRRGVVPGVVAPVPAPVVVALEPAARLGGRVVDEAGVGVAGARLDLILRSLLSGVEHPIAVGRPFEHSVATGDDGRFLIPGIDPGIGWLSAEAHGFVTPDPLPVEIAEGERNEGLEIVLTRGAEVAGQVLTEDGEPVAGARVTIESAGGFADAEGLYRFEGVPLGPGTGVVSHRLYRRQEREIEIVSGLNSLDWTLPAGQEVSGRVANPRGDPIAGARVRLRTEEKHDGRVLWTVSAADGSFRFDTVPGDEYRLGAEAEGYTGGEIGPVAVAGEPLDPFELTLRPAAVIAGTIHGLDFDELSQVEVQASRAGSDELRSGKVDWQGAYEVRGLGSGDWLVTASLDRDRRRVEARVPIDPGVEEIRRDLEFTDGPSLAGTVVFGGEPLADAIVSIRGLQSALERSVRSGYDGRFEISNLDSGTYWLGVTHRTERVAYNGSVELLADQEVLLDVSAADLVGTVTDAASGAALAGATVAVKRADGLPGAEGVIAASTDASGAFHLLRVTAGPYLLSARKDGYTPLERWLEVLPGGAESLDLELQSTAGLTLQVAVASGGVPPHIQAVVTGPAGRLLVAETRRVAPDGSVHLPTVPPGSWTLSLAAPGAALAEVQVVAPGEPLPVLLQPAGTVEVLVPGLRSSNQVATLRVFGADGAPLQEIDLTVGLRSAWPVTAGRASVEGVPAGVFTFQAQAPDGRTWTATVPTGTGAPSRVVLE